MRQEQAPIGMMLEVHEETTQLNKRDKIKKEKLERKESGDKSCPQRPFKGNQRTPSPHTHLQHLSASVAGTSGSLSMHSSNPKARNSPTGNSQSPVPKQEAMVRPSAVMSPSSTPQMDSKLCSQGKLGSSAGQSQLSPCDMKSASGNHTPKPTQGPVGNLGLKNGQAPGAGNGVKGKMKRERSASIESFEQRELGTTTNEAELKVPESGGRSKRLCVAERRQPYSGADWCSGGETDDDENDYLNCSSPGNVKSQESQHTPIALLPGNTGMARSSTPSHNSVGGPVVMAETAGSRKIPPKVVFVFSTEMANRAAEAVLKGQADSIVSYHKQNISNTKLEKDNQSTGTPSPAVQNESKSLPQQPSQLQEPTDAQTQSRSLHSQSSKPSTGTHVTIGQESSDLDSNALPTNSPQAAAPNASEGTGQCSTPSNRSSTPGSQGAFPPTSNSSTASVVDPKDDPKGSSLQIPGGDASNIEDNPEGLSQEQLEHRERSLQTLRDIHRMLFPDEKDFSLKEAAGLAGGPQENSGMTEGPPKKPDGPLQAMMVQSQNIGKAASQRMDGPHFGQPGHREMPFTPDEMIPQVMNSQGGHDHMDHMTPEQIAWLKLSQEFYEAKRRKQEQHRSVQDMMMHQHGPRGMIRGPPPPYQINPGEEWGPGGPEPFGEGMTIPNSMHPRGMAPHPNVAGNQVQRMSGFPRLMSPEIDGPGVPNPLQRSGLSGVSWPEDIPKMSDGRNFPPGQAEFSGPGRGERFPNPQSMSEEMFMQQLAEKQVGMPVGIVMDGGRPGIEINRMVSAQKHMEPRNGNMFPRLPGEGPMSPSRLEFSKGIPPQMAPGREVEFGMGPGNMNMNMKVDMSLNVNMNSSPQVMAQKIRDAGVRPQGMIPDDILKMRNTNPELILAQQKMMPNQCADHAQQDFLMGPRHFPNMPQGPGGGMRNPRDQFGPEHRTTAGANRLSHMPSLPLNPSQASQANPSSSQRNMGRKSVDITTSSSQVNSPGVNPLKSPTLKQVQSPMLGSPSANLKSPQTPSQLAGILTGQAAAAAASIKSPPVLGSATASPVHLKSPSLPAPSPGWTSSPKPHLQSPGIPQNKQSLNMASPGMMGTMESGAPPASTVASNLPGALSSGSPYTLPPEPTLSQNPLSIMMSRMSKFAMPSSTPLYHDAIKTVASSDDDSPPARSPNVPPVCSIPGVAGSMQNHPRMPAPNSGGQMAALSPLGMTQPLSHNLPNQMPSPTPMGPGMMSHSQMMPHGPQDPSMNNPQMIPQGRMGFAPGQQNFPPVHSPSQQIPFSHSSPSGGQGSFPQTIGFPGEGVPLGRSNNIPQPSADPVLCKPSLQSGPDSFSSMGSNMPSVFADPDLQEVIRPGVSGIPEFDLSRIIPSEKPSQTLQYFPRSDPSGRKQFQGPGPGFPHMQGMMVEQNSRMGLPIPSMGGPGPMGAQDMPMGNPGSLAGHNAIRAPAFLQQGMIGPQHRMMSPGQGGLHGQPTMMNNPVAAAAMMQVKERGPVGMYSHPGPVGSPNMMMSLQGMVGPQQSMIIPPQMRARGMSADLTMGGFSQGPGNPGNLML
ncbi:B-cell CLL/lymphoma 9 protein isoform X2 [Protopterus annectens]|uniref:B-cell CLL/lymphoma 9 protein isoform X2 n=1 Tax=Protopterus annectens TaxID=7888 RepID=UPI001CF93771|nr:B-cell CLL/lymphoma 9 protein isoform X2 [Protopterus annectens]